MTALDLYLHEQLVGTVDRAPRDRARVTLTVDRDYAPEVLLSEGFVPLPGRKPPVDAVTNFLGGYVPEGNHRERMAAKRRIDKDDLLALLSEFGGSIAGAAALRPRDERPSHEPRYEPLDERTLETKLRQAIDESDQGIPDDSRSTLPGFQPKVLVARDGDAWLAPHGRAHSTYILKPQVPGRPSRIFDEHYSHLLMRHIGLANYGSEIRVAGRLPYLAIERFDRWLDGETVRAHHQEDLAQALGLDWRDTDVKFQEPGRPSDPRRPSARRIGELLGSIPGGDAALERWISQLTYTLAIGDNDAHAKNVALLHLTTGTELAPTYDALPNLFQRDRIQWQLALAVDGEFDHRRVSVARILAEVQSWGVIAGRRAAAIVEATITALDAALAEVAPPEGGSPGLTERMRWNVDRLAAGLEISEPKSRAQAP